MAGCLETVMNGKKYVPKAKLVGLSNIILLPELQVREKLDEATVEEYVERLKRGEKAPPIEVIDAGKEHGHHLAIVDGFHRFEAAKKQGKAKILVVEHTGLGRKGAYIRALKVNTSHGLRLSLAERQKAVKTILKDETWKDKTSNWIAEQVGVDHKTVESWRDKLSGNSQAETHTGKDGKKYKAHKPKATPPAENSPSVAEPDEVREDATEVEGGAAAAASSDILALVKELSWELDHSNPTEAERHALRALAARIEADLAEEGAGADALPEGDDGDERDGPAAASGSSAPESTLPAQLELPKVLTVAALQPVVG